MRIIAFAVRSLLRQPARAALGVLGIAAVGALLFDMLLLSRGLLISFRDMLDGIGFDVRVAATEGTPRGRNPLPAAGEAIAVIRALPEVADVVPLRFGFGDTLDREGRRPAITLVGADARRRKPWTMLEGRDLPPNTPEAVLASRSTAERLGLTPGSTLKLHMWCADDSAPPPVEVQVVGIAEFPFDDAAARTIATSLPGFARACSEERSDAADLLLVAAAQNAGPDAAVAAIRRTRPDLYAMTNEEIVARMQRVGFSYFRQISTVLATITLLFGFLLITVLLTISVNQRLAEIAALRALGFSRARVVGDVLVQSAALVGAGGVLALPLGLGLSVWLDAILRAMPGIPATVHFFVFEPRSVVLHAVLHGTTAVAAALYPMYLVARLPIAATLRREVVS